MGLLKDIESSIMNMEAYLGVKMSSLGIFAACVAGAAVVSTALYWGIFGFGHWKNEMVVAGRIMTAAANQPVAQQVAPQTPQAVPQAGLATPQAGQYVCPTHGAVGLPKRSATGAAACPVCGQPMQLRCLPNGVTTAAFAGG
jgi:hypothetical protein